VILDRVVLAVDRPLMGLAMSCPDTSCGLHCRCTLYIPGEMATFECRACGHRYYVGLGAQPLLRVEVIG
jgi:hypothetical protein